MLTPSTATARPPKHWTSVADLDADIAKIQCLVRQLDAIQAYVHELHGSPEATSTPPNESKLPDEVTKFYTRKQIQVIEHDILETIGEVFGTSSPELERYRHIRLHTCTQEAVGRATELLENLAFELDLERLPFLRAGQVHAWQEVDIDPLTDLYTWRVFKRCLSTELARSHRHGFVFTLCRLRIEDWPSISALLGQTVSDTLIASLACALRATSRGSDAVARLGEADFAVLLPHTDRVGTWAFVRRAQEKFQQTLTDVALARGFRLSVGTATFPFDADRTADLIALSGTHWMFSSSLCQNYPAPNSTEARSSSHDYRPEE